MGVKLYSTTINTRRLEIDRHSCELDFEDEDSELALYNEDGWETIHAESHVSQETADKLAFDKAAELRDIFQKVCEAKP